MKYALVNGKLVEEEMATIPVKSKANFFDFGVYESIRVLKGKAFHPELNAERLFKSAKAIDLQISYSKEEILEWINKLIKANEIKDALLRVIIFGGIEKEPLRVYIFALNFHFYPKKLYSKGVKVITFKGERYLPEAKSTHMLLNYIALREAFKQDAVEALFVNRENCITEGTRSNFFAVKDNILITPPKQAILEGTTKHILEREASKLMTIKEGKIELGKLGEYEEFFITSTVFGVLPINQIGTQKFRVGEKTKELIKIFREYSRNYFKTN